MDPESLIHLLVDRELCGESEPQELLSEFESSGKELFDFLEASGFGGREEILRFVAKEQGRDFVDLTGLSMPAALTSAIDPELLRIYECLPLEVSDDSVRLCFCDPFDSAAIRELASILGKKIDVTVADPEQIRTLLADLAAARNRIDGGGVVCASLGRGPDADAGSGINQATVGGPVLLVALSVLAVAATASAALYLSQNRRLESADALVAKNESLLRQSEASRKAADAAIIQMESELDALEKLVTKREVEAIRLESFDKELRELRGKMEALGRVLAEMQPPLAGGSEGPGPAAGQESP